MGDNSKEGLDPSSRYYFHHSDTLATKLCLQLLDGGNWATWSKSVEIALSVKNKLGFVTGKIKKPSKSTDPDEFDLWERANHMLISWFSHSVSQDLVSSVLFAPTAQHIWEDFQARFAQGNLPRIFQIKSSIGSHVQGIMSVANYYTKLRGFWDELDSYRPFSTCDCCQCSEGSKSNQFSSNSSFSSSTSNTEGLFCRYCKKDTHTIESCYKLHGFPIGHPRHDPNFKPNYEPNFKPPSNRPE
ncbi:hypothetical protein RHGRI_031505 [Rhododendron griersonianum]|uniref:Retrotransposon Copia-like N-terminal domain-containing protein n=1 Tax=Rhododendron griersonianum TaxID=479676 RepID=A0AAV6IAP9_9ERIC|nr:hypothetical protein RHGRI_031505 [Rhododendron griersonianum]